MAELLKHKSPGQAMDLGVEVAGVEHATVVVVDVAVPDRTRKSARACWNSAQ